jgi:hypothetical protein
MNDLFKALRKAMYEYNHMDELSPRRKDVVINTYSRFENDYEFVDQLIPIEGQDEEVEKE